MTSKERLLCAMRGENPDRVPVAPFTLGALDRKRSITKELIERTDPIVPTWGGDPFAGLDAPMESIDEGDVTTTLLHTPRGALTQRVRHDVDTTWKIEPFCKSPKDIEAYLSIPWKKPETYIQHLLDEEEYFGDNALVLVDLPNAVMLPHRLLSPEDFCMMWGAERTTFEALMIEAQRRLEPFVENICAAGARNFRMIGGELVTVELGPLAFERLIEKNDSRIVDIIHRYGGLVYYHNHGRIMRWLEPLAGLGIDALDPLEAPPWGDADLRRASEILKGRVCMVGNIDDMEVLGKLSAEEVKKIGRKLLQDTGGRNFILGGTASGIYGEAAAHNFLALIEVAEEFAAT